MVRPENIMLTEKQITVYQAPGQTSWYTEPAHAQRDAARAFCLECGEKKTYDSTDYCKSCERKHWNLNRVKEYNDAAVWNGSYPVSINQRVFTEEQELVDWFAFSEYDPASFDLVWEIVTPRYPKDAFPKADLICQLEDAVGGEGTPSDAILTAIDEFCEKLAGIEEVLYYDVEYQVKPTAEQIEEIKRLLQIVHRSAETI